MKYNPDIHHRQSIRLLGHDYSDPGTYFVTICTKNRELLFGDIFDEKMVLNDIGKIADKFWQEIPIHFPFVDLGVYIIMPNHVHGIVIIRDDNICRDEALPRPYTGLYPEMSKRSPKAGSLSVIIGSFKSICSKIVRKEIDPDFAWQERFYDRIIRNDNALEKAWAYILDNPYMWYRDRNNPAGLGM